MIGEKMEIRMVDLKTQYQRIKPEIDTAIQQVIDDSAFIKGKYVKNFCSNLSEYLKVKHVIPCGNGTDAIQLALMAMDLEPGDEVITTAFTFVATVEVIVLLGLKPVFVDVDPITFNIDPQAIKQAITPKSRCIIPVHLFGQSADMTPIMETAKEHGLKVIEDTAQAIGATYVDAKQFCGTIGDAGTFSFFPSKNLGCYGDGGAVCTNDDDLAEKINLYANHGSKRKYYYDAVGINSRLDGIQAAILDIKLGHLNEYTSARRKAAEQYDELLKDVEGVEIPQRRPECHHVFHQYTIKLHSRRDDIKAALADSDIPAGIYYPSPLHIQPIYKAYHQGKPELVNTVKLCQQVLSLPMHSELNYEQQAYIVGHLKEAIKAHS